MNRAIELLTTVDPFGPMHIVVGDGNMADEHLDMVEDTMAKEGSSSDEKELLALLRTMNVDDRDAAWDAVNNDPIPRSRHPHPINNKSPGLLRGHGVRGMSGVKFSGTPRKS